MKETFYKDLFVVSTASNVVIYYDEDSSVIEYIGFSTGYRIIERLTKEMPRFKDELDTMKFICTDFWSAEYKKKSTISEKPPGNLSPARQCIQVFNETLQWQTIFRSSS
ncbi:hypothetical protein JTB14_019269 [Gonioctena quinquepunctata]|nr:hypothetical protein JTB14_019269 [Gonioctena quinquepunctata]